MAYAICNALHWPLFEKVEENPFLPSNTDEGKISSIDDPLFGFTRIRDEGEDFFSLNDFQVQRNVRYKIKGIVNKVKLIAKAPLHLLLITDFALGALLQVVRQIDLITGDRLGYGFSIFVDKEIKTSTKLLTLELITLLKFINRNSKISRDVIDNAKGILMAKALEKFDNQEPNVLFFNGCHSFRNPLSCIINNHLYSAKICLCASLGAPVDIIIAFTAAVFALITGGRVRRINDLAFRAMKGPETGFQLIAQQLPLLLINSEDLYSIHEFVSTAYLTWLFSSVVGFDSFIKGKKYF